MKSEEFGKVFVKQVQKEELILYTHIYASRKSNREYFF